MPKHWTKNYTIVTGTIRFKDLAYVAFQDDSIDADAEPHSIIAQYDDTNNEKWGIMQELPWLTVGMSTCKYPLEQSITIGAYGEAYLGGSGDGHEEFFGPAANNPDSRGPFRCVRGIGDRAYVAGMHREVYLRENKDLWIPIHKDMQPDSGEVRGFESIDGFSENDIHAVGWEGEIWHFNGQEWKQMDSPTNLILNDVCCAEDEIVYAAGQTGILLKGRTDRWQVIDHGKSVGDIWSLAWYDNHLFISTYRGVYILVDESLEHVDMGNDHPDTYYHLCAKDDILWSIGAKDIMAFDGTDWKCIE